MTKAAMSINKLAGLALIHALPPEILVRIFALSKSYCFCFTMMTPLLDNITYVCTRWRQIATSAPSLWTHIDIGPTIPTSLTLLLLERTRNAPVYVHFYLPQLGVLDEGYRDYQPYDVTEMLSPHILRVHSLDLQFTTSSTKFAGPLLQLWLNHGNTTTARSLLVRRPTYGPLLTAGEDHENGGKTSHPENSRRILRSLNTLNLRGAVFPWDSGVYHGLVDLRLDCFGDDIHIFASKLASILAASPALVVLKLADLTVTRTGGQNETSPVLMNCLKELRLVGIDSNSLVLVISLIAVPESRDDLSVGLPASRDAHAALQAFFLRTPVNSLHFYPPTRTGEIPYWGFFPPVGNLLLLERFNMGRQSIWNNPNGPLLPMGSCIPNLVLAYCPVAIETLSKIVAEHNIQKLRLEMCYVSKPDSDRMRDTLTELNPCLQCAISYRTSSTFSSMSEWD